MRDKVLIVLIWCMVPVCAMLFLAEDYRRFSTETLRQEQYCVKFRRHLDEYATRYGQELGGIRKIDSPAQRDLWRSSWRRIKSEQQRELNALGASPVSRYPQAGSLLAEGSLALSALEQQVEAALQKREMFLKSGNGLVDLQQQIYYLDDVSQHYRTIWTYGIYLDLQERLAQLEDEFHQRRNTQTILEEESVAALEDARRQVQELHASLNALPALMTQDQRVSYRDDLRNRILAFDLRGQLRKLVLGEAQASAQGQGSLP
jgi:hypothetical protein